MNVSQSQPIGKIDFKVNTDSQVGAAQHNRRKAFLSSVRASFLLLLRLNFWNLARMISVTSFEVNQQTTDNQKIGEKWWDIQAKWRNAWWNLGGSWNAFVNAVNKGKGRKPILIALAPRKIKDKLKSVGISGYKIGIGAAAETTALAQATGLIVAITPLIMLVVNLFAAKKKKEIDESEQTVDLLIPVDTESDTDFSFGLTDEAGNITTAGYGLIGVGVLGLLLLGTKGKKKLF